MKTGQIFWGVFFLVFGSLFFISDYNLINLNWSFAWDLWPLILIFWGLAIILKDSKVKPYISAGFGLIIAVIIFGIFSNISNNISSDDVEWDTSRSVTSFSEEWDKSIKNAHLEMHAGGGKFYINDKTNKLIEGKSKGLFSNSTFTIDTSDGIANIYYESSDSDIKIFPKKDLINYLNVKLNENPVWDIDLELGAAKLNFDLSGFKVASLNLESGATTSTFNFGSLQKDVKVNIEMGAAKLKILVPEKFGCKVTGDMVLVAKNLHGFNKTENFYITDNYEKAEGKIDININSGVSSVSIERY